MHSFNGSRQGRNLLDLNVNGFAPIHFPLTSYSTDSRNQSKEEMKHTYGDTLFFNNLHLIPDPLKKNLADSVITGEQSKKCNMAETKQSERSQRPDYYPSLAGITNFFSGVLNVMGAIFQKRTAPPTSQYFDCFENYNDQQMAQTNWQSSNIEVQNKNERDPFIFASNNEVNTNLEVDMSADCRLAASHCEEKLNEVKLMLNNKIKKSEQPTKFRSNRPRKAFIEAGAVEESFEDAFSPEELTSLANDTFIEYYSPYNEHNELFVHAETPKVKTEMCIKEPMDVVSSYIPIENKEKDNQNESTVINDDNFVRTEEIVSSCEDKLSKLKALLQNRKKVVNTETEVSQKEVEPTNPIPIPVHTPEKLKHHSKDLPNETVFGNEINSTELQSSQESDYFNEVIGKFHSSSLESDDSFQIVFSDSPHQCRKRMPSDCDSEDSFIVFEESPDSCYTSHDVFGENHVENNHSDSESDIEEDSGITCMLAHNLSRTFGDLTDDSLYSQDVVDSVKVCNDICNNKVTEANRGLLLSEKRKSEKQTLPPKKVTFSSQPPKVHVMRVWAFAARQARAGHWERHALDRERFKRRIADVEMAISWVFKRQHRTRIVFQRFRPWWNAERRRELAEKKEKAEREIERNKKEEIKALESENNNSHVSEGLIVKASKVNTNTKQKVKLNGHLDENDDTATKLVTECKNVGKVNDLSFNNECSYVQDTEYTLHENCDHSNITIGSSENDELYQGINEITPGINESIEITTDEKSSNMKQVNNANIYT